MEIENFIELHKHLHNLIIDFGKENILKMLELIEPAKEQQKIPKEKKKKSHSEATIRKIINCNPKDKEIAKEMGWTIGTLHCYHYSWKKKYPELSEQSKKKK